jgi:serpin B
MKRLTLLLITIALLAACGQPATATPATILEPTAPPTTAPPAAPTATAAGGEPAAPQTEFVRSEAARIADPDTSAQQVAELVQGNNTFATDLYHAVAPSSYDNLIFSPYSIHLAFSMVYAGARGETEEQIAQVLHYLPQAAQHPAYNALDQQLANLGQEPQGSGEEESAESEGAGTPFQLNIANAVWGQQGYPFQAPYLNLLAQQYGAGLRAVDFRQNPDQAAAAINDWVERETNDRIQNLAPPGSITPDTRLVLANAIYFKAAWRFTFNESNTQEAPFTLPDGSQVTVPMMQQGSARVPYTEGDGYQAVVMPYDGETVEMLLILPAEGQFEALEGQLSAGWLARVRDAAEVHDVALTMPRFEFESQLDLAQLLPEMGMPTPFGGAADFSGIADNGGLYISDALHKANITVNEKGTEAAAATLVIIAESEMPRAEVTLDRPFMFAIRARDTGAILFLGRVVNPKSE